MGIQQQGKEGYILSLPAQSPVPNLFLTICSISALSAWFIPAARVRSVYRGNVKSD